MEEKILIFGHKNPDTDSICSSLVMADLQTKIRGEKVTSCRLGNLNEETKYALNYFNTPTKPMIITHEKPSINNRCEKSSRIDDS